MIGQGGMGAVYRAKDTKLGRDVAVKVLPEAFAADGDRLARFGREAQILAALNHPNIAAIYGLEQNALVMELVEGAELRGPLELGEALRVARQIAEALEYAHEKGIVHRDLKPANIKLTPEGQVKVLDFGLAKAIESAPAGNLADSPTMTVRATQAGIIMGTAGYMSPEQAAGKEVDKRADIWAFGVILHELLTGKRLFHGETVSHTIAAVLKDPVETGITQAPVAIQRLLARCLDRNLKHRLRDIGEARVAIEDYLAGGGVEEKEKRVAKRPWALVGAVGAAMLLVGFAAAWFWPRGAASGEQFVNFSIPRQYVLPMLSPDGKWVAAIFRDSIYLRPLNNTAWRKLEGTVGLQSNVLFWSRQSDAIGFARNNQLQVLPLNSNNPIALTEVKNYRGADWRGNLTDGLILFIDGSSLKTMDLRSREVKTLPLEIDSRAILASPMLLPTGDRFLFSMVIGSVAGSGSLMMGSLKEKAMKPLIQNASFARIARYPLTSTWHLFWFQNGFADQNAYAIQTARLHPETGALESSPQLLANFVITQTVEGVGPFSVGDNGYLLWRPNGREAPEWRLTWMNERSEVLGRVGPAGRYSSVELSPKETHVLVRDYKVKDQALVFDLRTGLSQNVGPADVNMHGPCWAADGESIYIPSRRDDRLQILRYPLDAPSNPEVVWIEPKAESVGRVSCVGVTPNGRTLAAIDNVATFLVPLDAKNAPPRASSKAFNSLQTNVSLTRDGKSLVASSRNGLFRIEIEDQSNRLLPPVLLSPKRVFSSRVSADGRRLSAIENSKLYSVPLIGNKLGNPALLFDVLLSPLIQRFPFDVSRDGQRYLVIERDDTEDLLVQGVTDWTKLKPAPVQ